MDWMRCMNTVLIGILCYILAQAIFALAMSRKIRTEEDYVLAGRSLGYMLGTFTIFATWFGAETCVGAAGKAYKGGLSETTADPFGFGLCLILMGFIFAIPLWRRKLTTLADLYQKRYDWRAERLAVLMMVPGPVLWGSAQLRAVGEILVATSDGVNIILWISLATVIVILYTTIGGMSVSAWTDVIQGIGIVLGLGIIGGLVLYNTESAGAALPTALSGSRLSIIPPESSMMSVLEAWAIPVCGSVVGQELVARVIATKSPTVAKRSALIAGTIYLLIGAIPVALGVLGPDILIEKLTEAQHDQFLIRLAKQVLPIPLYILFAGGLLSAIFSTVNGVLLTAATITAHNLVIPLMPGLDERKRIRANRLGVVFFGIIAYVIAVSAPGVYDLVIEASSFSTAGIFITVIFALFTKFGGPKAAMGSLMGGLVGYVGSNYGHKLWGGAEAWNPYPFLSALGLALALYIALGLIERKQGYVAPELPLEPENQETPELVAAHA
jgi:Na+/proline symporter